MNLADICSARSVVDRARRYDVKAAGTSFLARGVDYHRASRVSNTYDRGGKFKTRKTKTNKAARGFIRARSLCTVGDEIRI